MPLYSGSTSISDVTGLQTALDGKQVSGSYGPKFTSQGTINCPAGNTYTLPVETNGYFDLRIPQDALPNTTPYVITIPNDSLPTVLGNTHLVCFEPLVNVGSSRPIEFRNESGNTIANFSGSATLNLSGHRYFANAMGSGWVNIPSPASLANKDRDGQYTILVHHATALSPAAGGAEVFFGYPSDLAAVTSNTERGFSVPATGRIISVTMTIHNSTTNGTSPAPLTARLRLWNKSGGSPVMDESWTGLNPSTDNGRHPYGQTHRTISWSIGYTANLLAGETYVVSAEIPATGGTQAAGIRHYVNLLIQRF